MKKKVVWSLFLVLGLALAFSACGTIQKPVVLETKTHNAVRVKMLDYAFDPNSFQSYNTILFRLDNPTGRDHNFTLKDPDGRILQSVDVAPGKTAEVKADLTRTGIYTFSCNKFFHSTRGMKGQVVVVER